MRIQNTYYIAVHWCFVPLVTYHIIIIFSEIGLRGMDDISLHCFAKSVFSFVDKMKKLNYWNWISGIWTIILIRWICNSISIDIVGTYRLVGWLWSPNTVINSKKNKWKSCQWQSYQLISRKNKCLQNKNIFS